MKQKTPGQRLRGVLYRIWEQSGAGNNADGGVSFELWYRSEMERIINAQKERLE